VEDSHLHRFNAGSLAFRSFEFGHRDFLQASNLFRIVPSENSVLIESVDLTG